MEKTKNKLKRDLKNAKWKSLHTKVKNGQDNWADMLSAVQNILWWGTGGTPEMLTTTGVTLQTIERWQTYYEAVKMASGRK